MPLVFFTGSINASQVAALVSQATLPNGAPAFRVVTKSHPNALAPTVRAALSDNVDPSERVHHLQTVTLPDLS